MDSFWEALAFIIVKGIASHMPPLVIMENINSNPQSSPSCTITSTDVLEDMLHGLSITSCSRSSPTSLAPSSPPSPSTSQADVSPLVYSHVCNLHGIISSNYYQMPTSDVECLAQPLSTLAMQYLVSHGYGTSDVTMIVRIRRHACDNDQFVLDLARCGMTIAEVKFLLVLIAQCKQ